MGPEAVREHDDREVRQAQPQVGVAAIDLQGQPMIVH